MIGKDISKKDQKLIEDAQYNAGIVPTTKIVEIIDKSIKEATITPPYNNDKQNQAYLKELEKMKKRSIISPPN